MAEKNIDISIITPSLNQLQFIEETIQSVLEQQGDFTMEYIVMDGGSNDGTLKILKKYEDRLKWISSKDEGQSDAINKGLKLSKGKIIGWLNADDLYLPGTLQTVIACFNQEPEYKWLYGKCRIINEEGKEIRRAVTLYKNLISGRFNYRRLLVENYISQPAVFFRKELFEELGHTNTDLHYAMDYELWLRIGKKYPAGVIREYLASFRRHSNSKSESDFGTHFHEELNIAEKAHNGKFILFLHRLNIYKIIILYKIFRKLGI